MKPSNCTSTHYGDHLCHIILKSIYKYRNHGPDKPGQISRHVRARMHAHKPKCRCGDYVWLTASGHHKIQCLCI